MEETLAPKDLHINLLWSGVAPLAALSQWWDSAMLWDADWHCSSCYLTSKQMQIKTQSFSHRPGETYTRVNENQDLPQFVLDANRKDGRFKYLLSRDGQDAGFGDTDQMAAD